jgi:predicted Zn-dependent protease
MSQGGGIPLFFNITAGDGMLPLGMLKTARQHEIDADRYSVRATASAGYDPAALIRYIDRVQSALPDRPHSSLPPRHERLAALWQTVQTLTPQRSPATQGFDAARDQVSRILNRPHPRKNWPPTLRRAVTRN